MEYCWGSRCRFAHSIYICVHTNIYYITEYTRYSKINLLNVARSNVSDVPEVHVDGWKEENSEVKTIFSSSSMPLLFEINIGELSLVIPFELYTRWLQTHPSQSSQIKSYCFKSFNFYKQHFSCYVTQDRGVWNRSVLIEKVIPIALLQSVQRVDSWIVSGD